MQCFAPSYISAHRAHFNAGASRFISGKQMDRFGISQADGTSFVVPTKAANRLVEISKDHPEILERLLGLPRGQLSNSIIVKLDFHSTSIHELNLRMPSGTEAGVNIHWLPSGHLYNKIPEAVIDGSKAVHETHYTVSALK